MSDRQLSCLLLTMQILLRRIPNRRLAAVCCIRRLRRAFRALVDLLQFPLQHLYFLEQLTVPPISIPNDRALFHQLRFQVLNALVQSVLLLVQGRL